MATYPTIYTNNGDAYMDFMHSNFGGFGVSELQKGAAKGVTIDPTILFTNGTKGEEIDRLEGSQVNQAGVNTMFERYGRLESNNTFIVRDNGNNDSKIPAWLIPTPIY